MRETRAERSSSGDPLDFYLGLAVWAYRGFIGELYPPGAKSEELLSLFGARLTAVEGNTTFYALPDEETVKKWEEALPQRFAFCPKLDRRVTHESARLCDGKQLTMTFLERMSHLGEKLGPILVQLPPNYGPSEYQDLKQYVRWWPHDRFEMALEVRHPGWWLEAPARGLDELLSEVGAARVILDTRPIYHDPDDPQDTQERRKPQLPLTPTLTAPFTLVRFIAHPDPEITKDYLSEWSTQVAEWLEEGERVIFFSHCPEEERSPGYARTIQRELEAILGERLPPLPWDSVPAPPKQLGLF